MFVCFVSTAHRHKTGHIAPNKYLKAHIIVENNSCMKHMLLWTWTVDVQLWIGNVCPFLSKCKYRFSPVASGDMQNKQELQMSYFTSGNQTGKIVKGFYNYLVRMTAEIIALTRLIFMRLKTRSETITMDKFLCWSLR